MASKVDEILAAYVADNAKVKAAVKVQRERMKNLSTAHALGLLTAEQETTLTGLLPKKRAPRATS